MSDGKVMATVMEKLGEKRREQILGTVFGKRWESDGNVMGKVMGEVMVE